MDHIPNEEFGEGNLINNLGSLSEELYKTIKKSIESIVCRPGAFQGHGPLRSCTVEWPELYDVLLP